jgi:hypothetical protein
MMFPRHKKIEKFLSEPFKTKHTLQKAAYSFQHIRFSIIMVFFDICFVPLAFGAFLCCFGGGCNAVAGAASLCANCADNKICHCDD